VKTGYPRIEFGTITDALARLNLPRTGFYIGAVREQFRRWLGTTIQYLERGGEKTPARGHGGVKVPLQFTVVQSYAIDWIDDENNQEEQNYALLSEDCMKFFIKGKSIPIPFREYVSTGEPLRQDALVFLSRKNYILNRFCKKDLYIPRANVLQQFGPPGILETFYGPGYWKNFRAHVDFIRKHYWPELRYEFTADGRGFRLKRSPLLVDLGDENAGHLPDTGSDSDLEEDYS
jgi:hypothetical protein